jgi:hypothetical protein
VRVKRGSLRHNTGQIIVHLAAEATEWWLARGLRRFFCLVSGGRASVGGKPHRQNKHPYYFYAVSHGTSRFSIFYEITT